MANATTVTDLRDDSLERAGEATDGSSTYTARALKYLNRAYHDSWFWRPWLFTIKNVPASVNVVAPIRERTVSVTNGSTAINFDAGITPSIEGRKIEIGDSWYRISQHTSGGSGATLGSAYQEADGSGLACTIYQDEYEIGDADFARIARIFDIRNAHWLRSLSLDDPAIRAELYEPTQGEPDGFAMLTDKRFILTTYPQRAGRLEVHYQFFPPDLAVGGADPLWPRWRRWLLADRTTAMLMVDKNDDRAQAANGLWQGGLDEMEREFNQQAGATGVTRNVEVII